MNPDSIASDTLWIRNIRHRYAETMLHMPQVRDRYTYRIAVAYLATKLWSCYLHATLLLFLRHICDVCMANRSCYESVTIFKNIFLEKIVTPFQTLANEEIMQRISYGSFRCCDVAEAFLAIGDTPYIGKPIR